MKTWIYVGATSAALISSLLSVSVPAHGADAIKATLSPSNAVYAPDVSQAFALKAVRGDNASETLIISNRTDQPLVVQDLNHEVVVIIKPGVTLDLGSASRDLPDVVRISQPGKSGGHYTNLENGLVLTAVSRDGGAS